MHKRGWNCLHRQFCKGVSKISKDNDEYVSNPDEEQPRFWFLLGTETPLRHRVVDAGKSISMELKHRRFETDD